MVRRPIVSSQQVQTMAKSHQSHKPTTEAETRHFWLEFLHQFFSLFLSSAISINQHICNEDVFMSCIGSYWETPNEVIVYNIGISIDKGRETKQIIVNCRAYFLWRVHVVYY